MIEEASQSEKPPVPIPDSVATPGNKTVLQRLGIKRERSVRDARSTPALESSVSDSQAVIAAPAEPLGHIDEGSAETVPTEPMDYVSAKDLDEDPTASSEMVERSSTNPATRPNSASQPPTPRAELHSPQPYRPVVVRTTAGDGTTSTTVVSEQLLRGRRAVETASQTPSRSSTPGGGTKGNRFKSTPVQRGRSTEPQSATQVQRHRGSSLAQDSTFDGGQ